MRIQSLPTSCAACLGPLSTVFRAEVRPNDLFDDASLMILACADAAHGGTLALVQSERRGSMDDETIETDARAVTADEISAMKAGAAACPDLQKWSCACAWHASHGADAWG